METCLRQIREFGEAVIVIDQEPSKLSNSIKANTYAKITFALGNGVDIRDMATCMHLTEEEEAAIDLLITGHAVVSLKGRVQTPLHVRFKDKQGKWQSSSSFSLNDVPKALLVLGKAYVYLAMESSAAPQKGDQDG